MKWPHAGVFYRGGKADCSVEFGIDDTIRKWKLTEWVKLPNLGLGKKTNTAKGGEVVP